MRAPATPRRTEVLDVEELGAYRLLTLADPSGPRPVPGQFYMLASAQRWGGGTDDRPYLARAFSFARVLDDGALQFLLEVVGPGTERLCELRPGEGATLLGPLGHGFQLNDGEDVTLVGGGIGIAPLIALADVLRSPPHALLGFRDAHHAEAARLLPFAAVATDDGSVGHAGLVTELLDGGGIDGTVCACGPPPMLEAVRGICAQRGTRALLALEAGMACGFGACHGCVVPARGGRYLRVCVDGPVIEADELERVA